MSDAACALYYDEEKGKKLGFTFVAAIDFGTSNSGVVWGYADKDIVNKLNNATASQGDNYAKVPTVLVVHRSLLAQLGNLKQVDLIINDYTTPGNVFFGHHANQYFKNNAFNSEQDPSDSEWVRFEYFKMALYQGEGNTIEGSDGNQYDLLGIIELYLRCLILTTYNHMAENSIDVKKLLEKSQDGTLIRWGVTIPTIWEAEQKAVMEKAAKRALDGQDIIFLLEPEGAAMNFVANENLELKSDMTFMVVDCGGGTTDIVVQRVVQKGNKKSMEEVVRAQGKAAAGWEMDKRFFDLLARTLAAKSKSISSREAYQKLIQKFVQQEPYGKLELDKMWVEYKHNVRACGQDCIFTLPQEFAGWIRDEFPEILEADEFRGRRNKSLVRFTKQQIENEVFLPVCQQIADEVDKVIESLNKKNVHLDYLFGAGGLIGLPVLQEKLKDVCPDDMDTEKQCLFASADARKGHRHGGAILEGATCMLVFDDCIARVAKRYYYHSISHCITDVNIAKLLWNSSSLYQEHIPFEKFKEVFAKEVSFMENEIIEGEHRVMNFLVPVMLPDILATKFVNNYYPIYKNQKRIAFKFFSSTQLHIFHDRSISDLRAENDEKSGSFDIEGDNDQVYRMVIDFNEFQQNYFDVNVYHAQSNEHKATIRITPELKNGH